MTRCAAQSLLLRLTQTPPICFFVSCVSLCLLQICGYALKLGVLACALYNLVVLFLLPFFILFLLETALKEFHFLHLHLPPSVLFAVLNKELHLFIC